MVDGFFQAIYLDVQGEVPCGGTSANPVEALGVWISRKPHLVHKLSSEDRALAQDSEERQTGLLPSTRLTPLDKEWEVKMGAPAMHPFPIIKSSLCIERTRPFERVCF